MDVNRLAKTVNQSIGGISLFRHENESSIGMQDYLKAIAILSNGDSRVTTTQLSKHNKVAPATVTEMLKKLAEKGFVNYLPRHGVKLTLKGTVEAQRIIRKYVLLERLFSDILHLKEEKVHSQACAMEHALSDDVEEALYRFLNRVDKTPTVKLLV